MLGESASAAEVAEVRARLGLNEALPRQYVAFLWGAATGDLGTSLRTNQPVMRVIAERIPATLALAVTAMAVAILAALPLGIVAAARAGSSVDRAATAVALIGISIPNFWLG